MNIYNQQYVIKKKKVVSIHFASILTVDSRIWDCTKESLLGLK